jgi:Ser-tRNA(Ala) deacylase AlaX
MATKLLYMDDFGIVACEAIVTEIKNSEDGRTIVVLDQTCFYPRGGGQDWDTGKISASAMRYAVSEVRLDEGGVVHHYIVEDPKFEVGETVQCSVDHERRNVNTRLHSAGHVLDMATSSLRPNLIPAKGAHYPHMSFVEYEGIIDDPEELTKALQVKIDELLAQKITNTLKFVNLDELKTLCRHVPANLPSNKPIRVVLYGDFGVPCGGTHVKNLSDIGKLEITKVKSKKGITKIGYRVDGIN